jgi:hypothetical protein
VLIKSQIGLSLGRIRPVALKAPICQDWLNVTSKVNGIHQRRGTKGLPASKKKLNEQNPLKECATAASQRSIDACATEPLLTTVPFHVAHFTAISVILHTVTQLLCKAS